MGWMQWYSLSQTYSVACAMCTSGTGLVFTETVRVSLGEVQYTVHTNTVVSDNLKRVYAADQCGGSGSVESVSFPWIQIRIKNGWIRNPDPDPYQMIRIRIQLKPLKT